jgi:hypothetical protein
MQKDKLLQGIAALAIAALAGGCFQPLYGEESPTGGPVLRDQLSAVHILQMRLRAATRHASQSKSATRCCSISAAAARPHSRRIV